MNEVQTLKLTHEPGNIWVRECIKNTQSSPVFPTEAKNKNITSLLTLKYAYLVLLNA